MQIRNERVFFEDPEPGASAPGCRRQDLDRQRVKRHRTQGNAPQGERGGTHSVLLARPAPDLPLRLHPYTGRKLSYGRECDALGSLFFSPLTRL